MARKEKELHQQLYPGWSARDNYASHAKKKKRKREVSNGENRGYKNGENESWEDDCANAKKCRARFGLDQQTQWCKPCRSDTDSPPAEKSLKVSIGSEIVSPKLEPLPSAPSVVTSATTVL
ncbi:hypothetical protein LSH36_409g02023 [Paralvinella palmiformis]|uniref:Uncharacterized protein n=1 Tax=Paralvinella palmiformis TaxID=53620 RepID=A0AAD9JDF6_9ANNE|nr:hypothetical protein LSH36_409g02023 [Paralvinella palmiformis]